MIEKIKESLRRWGHVNLDKRETITDEFASKRGWLVLRGRVVLDVVMPDTKMNRVKKLAHDTGDWKACRVLYPGPKIPKF